MQSETIPGQPVWADLSGTILPGGYELKELFEADGDAARFRVRVLGDRDLDASAQFLHVSADETSRLTQIWELMRALRHQNLSAPLGAGSWERDGNELAYVVLRRADEALETVLRDRPLSPAETTEVLLSVARALEALHINGLVHGCVSPEQVLAVGDAIQLPVTCIRPLGREPEMPLVNPKYLAPESLDADGEDGENITAESDIWCLGATVFEAVTQKEWSEESRSELGALPEPFATIATRCLEEDAGSRGKLAEVVALLRGEVKPATRPRAAAAAVGAKVVNPSVIAPLEPAAAPAAPVPTNLASGPAAAPLVDSVPLRQPKKEEQRTTSFQPAERGEAAFENPERFSPPPRVVRAPAQLAPPKGTPRAGRIWLVAGLAVLFVLGLVWMLRPKSPVPSAAVASSSTAKPQASPVAPPAGETHILRPDGTATPKAATPAPAAAKPVDVPRNARVEDSKSATGKTINGDVWRVIVYTYAREADAQKKSEEINRKHAGLHTEVFSPSGNDGPYLVTIPGGSDRNAANQLRRQAVGSGLPHDSYIQNYSR